jgi:hypothetical protein
MLLAYAEDRVGSYSISVEVNRANEINHVYPIASEYILLAW